MSHLTFGWPRRIAVTSVVVVVAAAFSASAAQANVAVTAFTGGPGQNASVTPPTNRTENRNGDQIKVTVTGPAVGVYTVLCKVDGVAFGCTIPATGVATTITMPGAAFALGSHELSVKVTDSSSTDTQFYTWRIEPPQYKHLVTKSAPGSSAYAYWPLDDPPGATGSTVADASLAGNHPGQYQNYMVQRQPGIPTCEEQGAAPHSPWSCDWEGNDPFNAALNALDPLNPTFGNGRDSKGYSAWFSGRDDYIQVEDMAGTNGGQRAVEAWVRPQFDQESRGIFQHTQALWAEPLDANHMQFACSALNDEGNAAVSNPIPNGTFNGGTFHVVCTYYAGIYYMFVNGAPGFSHHAATQPGGSPQGFIGLVNKAADKWWKGYIDDVAYYDHALSLDEIRWHYQTGTITDFDYGNNVWQNVDVAPPSRSKIAMPSNHAQFSVDAQGFKAPDADYSCTDITVTGSLNGFGPDVGGPGTTNAGDCYLEHSTTSNFSAGVTVVPFGTPLPLTPGVHYVRLVAVDGTGNPYKHVHQYYVSGPATGYQDLIKCTGLNLLSPAFLCDKPLAYYRLNEPVGASTIVDSSGNGYDGDYKNDQDSGSTGISGDADNSRAFFGQGGYAAINNIAAPRFGYTMELWWRPYDDGDMMLMQQGSNGSIYYSDGKVWFRPDERAGSRASVSLPMPSTSGNWYHVAATYDGIVGKLYVTESTNSTLLSGAALTGVEHWQDGAGSADTLYLGYGTEAPWLRGELDEVVYYDVALSATKLAEHFNADPPADGADGDAEQAAIAKSTADSQAVAIASKPAAAKKAADAKAKAKAKARAKARAKAKAKALAKAKARAKAKAKARAKAKALAKIRARHHH